MGSSSLPTNTHRKNTAFVVHKGIIALLRTDWLFMNLHIRSCMSVEGTERQ